MNTFETNLRNLLSFLEISGLCIANNDFDAFFEKWDKIEFLYEEIMEEVEIQFGKNFVVDEMIINLNNSQQIMLKQLQYVISNISLNINKQSSELKRIRVYQKSLYGA